MGSTVATRTGRAALLALLACLLGQSCPAAAPPPDLSLSLYGMLDDGRGLHEREWNHLAFAPDGRTIAVSLRGKVALWEAASLRVRAAADTQPFGRLAFLSGRQLFAGGKTSVISELPHFRAVAELPVGRDDHFGYTVVSPDGRLVAHVAYTGPVLWDLARRRREGPLGGLEAKKGGRGWCAVAFSPDGKTLATTPVEGDDKAHLWDPATRRQLAALPGNGTSSNEITFSPCGRYLAVGGAHEPDLRILGDRLVRVHDLVKGRPPLRLEGSGSVGGLAFSPDGSLLAATFSGRGGGEVRPARLRAWLMPSGRLCLDVPVRHAHQLGLTFSPDGSLLAVWAEGEPAVYRLPGARPPAPAAKTERPELPAPPPALLAEWGRLADPDPHKAWLAVHALGCRPRQAAVLAAAKLRPVPHAAVARHVAALDSDEFAPREAAEKALRTMGDVAWPALRRALESGPSAEAKRRLSRLLEGADGPLTDPERLREVRAVEALELSGDGDAKAVLAWLAGGDPDARLTREARWSLHRLSRRPADAKSR